MRIFRNVFRRKMRAFLTIFGITIGVFALVVMGSMAEKINLLIDGGTRYYSDKVIVSDGSTPAGGFSTTPISVGRIQEIEDVPGVARATAGIYMLLDEEGGMSMGVPQGILGSDLRSRGYEAFKLSDGGRPRPRRRRSGARPSSAATSPKRSSAKVGGTVQLRGKPFEVIGIYDKTLTAPDNTVVDQPPRRAATPVRAAAVRWCRQQVDPDQLATSITAYPDPGVERQPARLDHRRRRSRT